jgi:hypothetical protein
MGESMDGQYYIAGVDASRTKHLAFAAKHALFNIFVDFFDLATHDHQLCHPQVKMSEMARRTGGHAGSTSDTYGEGWLKAKHESSHILWCLVQVNFLALVDAISEIRFHPV